MLPQRRSSNPEDSQTSCCIGHTPDDLLDMLCRCGPASGAHSRRPARSLGRARTAQASHNVALLGIVTYLCGSPQRGWQICSKISLHAACASSQACSRASSRVHACAAGRLASQCAWLLDGSAAWTRHCHGRCRSCCKGQGRTSARCGWGHMLHPETAVHLICAAGGQDFGDGRNGNWASPTWTRLSKDVQAWSKEGLPAWGRLEGMHGDFPTTHYPTRPQVSRQGRGGELRGARAADRTAGAHAAGERHAPNPPPAGWGGRPGPARVWRTRAPFSRLLPPPRRRASVRRPASPPLPARQLALQWTIVTMFSTNVTIYHRLISQAGWNRCNLSIYISIYLSTYLGQPCCRRRDLWILAHLPDLTTPFLVAGLAHLQRHNLASTDVIVAHGKLHRPNLGALAYSIA